MIGPCRRCNRNRHLEPHHPLPKRHFGGGTENSWTVPLCQECHVLADRLTVEIDRAIVLAHRAENVQRYVDAFTPFMQQFPKLVR